MQALRLVRGAGRVSRGRMQALRPPLYSAPGKPMLTGLFDLLSPDAAMRAVEQSCGISLDGTMETYPSYVNRVYGLRAETGERYVVKFYRPGRWSRDAILDEHAFLLDCS